MLPTADAARPEIYMWRIDVWLVLVLFQVFLVISQPHFAASASIKLPRNYALHRELLEMISGTEQRHGAA